MTYVFNDQSSCRKINLPPAATESFDRPTAAVVLRGSRTYRGPRVTDNPSLLAMPPSCIYVSTVRRANANTTRQRAPDRRQMFPTDAYTPRHVSISNNRNRRYFEQAKRCWVHRVWYRLSTDKIKWSNDNFKRHTHRETCVRTIARNCNRVYLNVSS